MNNLENIKYYYKIYILVNVLYTIYYKLSEMNFFSNFLGNSINPLKLNKLIN
jgi:hypothetical protein